MMDRDKIKILFLDDMEERHKSFEETIELYDDSPRYEIDHVYTAYDAVEKIRATRYDQVFLDHDLSEDDIMIEPNAVSKEPTGMDVVDHIMTMEHPPSWIVIHSCNEPAAQLMQRKLNEHPAGIRVTRQAFPWLIAFMTNAANAS